MIDLHDDMPPTGYDEADRVRDLRARYGAIRGRSLREGAASPAAFDAAVLELLGRLGVDGEPENWLAAAQLVTFPCRRCAGTGRFITRVENGVPTGPGGICFRCQGRGVQSDADARRNYGADLHRSAF